MIGLGLIELDGFLCRTSERVRCVLRAKGTTVRGMEEDDIVQETLVSVMRGLEQYDPNKASLSTYTGKIIENCIKDCCRKASTFNLRVVCASDPLDGDCCECAVDFDVTESVCLREFLEEVGLTDMEKKVLVLKYQGFSGAEIAERQGITAARVSQLLKKLKERLM